MKNSEKIKILNFLAEQKLMSLATTDGKTLWSATVYFLFDHELNFYFLSSPDTRHCKNIAKNTTVSLTVADSRQLPKDLKIGLQVSGNAKRVSSIANFKKIISMWNKRFAGKTKLDYDTIMKAWKSRFYKIAPSEIQMFDQKEYGDNETKSWKI